MFKYLPRKTVISSIYETPVCFISHKQLSAVIQLSAICYDLAQKNHSYQLHWPIGCLQEGQLMISLSFLLQSFLTAEWLQRRSSFSLQVASLNSHRSPRRPRLAVLRSVAYTHPSARGEEHSHLKKAVLTGDPFCSCLLFQRFLLC